MCIYSPMPHTLSYCALIGKRALIRSNTVKLFTHDFTSEYIELIISNNFPSSPFLIILYQRPFLYTESNVLFRSMNAQYNLFFFRID